MRARELKHALAAADLASRRFAGARGLKLIVAGQRYSGPAGSRPRARGFETPAKKAKPVGSRPTWARGLKPVSGAGVICVMPIASHVAAWVKTGPMSNVMVGAWIETRSAISLW
jgi:hypothetical protein